MNNIIGWTASIKTDFGAFIISGNKCYFHYKMTPFILPWLQIR